MPTFFALPHSEACSDTSMPVGSRPRNAAMMSHEPSGVSMMKKFAKAESGAGLTRYTATVETKRIPASTRVTDSRTA